VSVPSTGQSDRQDLVEPEVGDERESVRRVEIDGVGVRLFLARSVDAGAGVLDEPRAVAEPAVVLDRKRGDAAAAVVRREDVFPRLVDNQVTRSAATGRLDVQSVSSPLLGSTQIRPPHPRACRRRNPPR